jgi:hypothetical protein
MLLLEENMLSAYQNKAFDWLREHRNLFDNMDAWQKMAFIYCTSALPKDEKTGLLIDMPITVPLRIFCRSGKRYLKVLLSNFSV